MTRFTLQLNPLLLDVLFVVLLSLITLLLVHILINTRNKVGVLYVLPALFLMVFFFRAFPNIILLFPPLGDPYYHFVSALNILEFGSTSSHITSWYVYSTLQLNWPLMHVMTCQLTLISGLDVMFYFKWLLPFIGFVFFLGSYTYTFRLCKKYNVALIAALLCTMSITTIFYQSEFHPQGLAIVYFVFFLLSFIHSRDEGNVAFTVITLVFVFSLTFSHHFSSLFIAIVSLSLGLLSISILKFPFLRQSISYIYLDFIILLLIPILVFYYYIYTNISFLIFFASWSTGFGIYGLNNPLTGNPVLTIIFIYSILMFVTFLIKMYPHRITLKVRLAQRRERLEGQLKSCYVFVSHRLLFNKVYFLFPITVFFIILLWFSSTPFLTSILNSTKWILVIVTVFAIPEIIHRNNPDHVRSLLILVVICTLGAMGIFLIVLPLDRILSFIMPIISTFSAVYLISYYAIEKNFGQIRKYLVITLISLVVVTGILGSQSPVYFFQTSEPDAHYFYDNKPPNAVETEQFGKWFVVNAEDNKTHGVTDATVTMVFYYGQISDILTKSITYNCDYYTFNKNNIMGLQGRFNELSYSTNSVYSGPNIHLFSSY